MVWTGFALVSMPNAIDETKFLPKGFSFDEINDVSSNSEPEFTQPWHLNGRCPEGTIPIRRTKEEDLLRAGSVANFGRKKYHTIPHAQSKDAPSGQQVQLNF